FLLRRNLLNCRALVCPPRGSTSHEGPVLAQVRQDPAPRLQGRAPPRQGVRDLQEQPEAEGAPALSRGTASRSPRGRLPCRPRPFPGPVPGVGVATVPGIC